jgi:tight adherence protein B
MTQDDLMFYGLLAFAALCVISIVYLVVSPFLTGERRAEKRVQDVAEASRTSKPGGRTGGSSGADIAVNRKRQVAEAIKEMEEQQKARSKVSLRQMIQRAGIELDVKTFWIMSVVCGVVLGVLTKVFAPSLPIFAAGAVAMVGALGLPRWVLGKLITRRQNKFLAEFANAIDVIVRGVKSGLPLNECLNIIARESPDPINSEFKEVVDQQRVGVTLHDCFERMMVRMPLAEVRFFGIVIGIQQQAGGNLSEALGNLSGVLRDRKRLQSKVQALSAEAKASAGVLGILPPAVMILVYLSTPDYIAVLWRKQYGVFLSLFGGFWMFCGIMIMRKMINFKY